MKKLFLLWIFSGSLDSFSQAVDTTTIDYYCPIHKSSSPSGRCWRCDLCVKDPVPDTPDTLRAICLVTLFPNGIAHARMGYVVIAEGKEVEYLDCRKRALKLPQAGWGYRVVNPNNQK